MQRLLMFLICLALTSCGTLYSHCNGNELGKEKIHIHTNGDINDISVYVNDKLTVLHEGTIVLDKQRPAHFVTLKKDGYIPVTQYFSRRWNEPIIILDSLLIVPLIVDAVNHEIFRIEPTDIRVILRKEN